MKAVEVGRHYNCRMAIQRPTPRYSPQDKRLIALLARLVVEASSTEGGGNVPKGTIVLTDAECDELIRLLAQLLASGEFLEETYFIENLNRSHDRQLRNLFDAARVRRGRPKAMGWLRYNEFQNRFWIGTTDDFSTRPMNFDYFKHQTGAPPIRPERVAGATSRDWSVAGTISAIGGAAILRLEDRLLREIGVHPNVRMLVLRLLDQHRHQIDGIRKSPSKRRSISSNALTQELSPPRGGEGRVREGRRRRVMSAAQACRIPRRTLT